MADIFKPQEMLQLFKGKKLLIIGDSSKFMCVFVTTCRDIIPLTLALDFGKAFGPPRLMLEVFGKQFGPMVF